MIRNNSPAATDTSSPSVLATAQTPLRLRFVGSQRHGQIIRINSSKCTIGSAPEATFRLICPGVQPIHCLVVRGSQGMLIRRMSIDTLLNGHAFDDSPLQIGDRLSIGPIELEVLPFQPQTSDDLSAGEQARLTETIISSLREELQGSQSQADHLQQQLEATQGDLSQRDEELRALRQELDETREHVAQIEQQSTHSDEIEAVRTESEAALQGLRNEIDSLRHQLDEAHHRNHESDENSQQRQRELTDELSVTQNQIAELAEQLNHARNELADKDHQLTATGSELEAVQARLAEAEDVQDLAELESRCQQLDHELAAANEEREALGRERQSLHDQLEAVKDDANSQLVALEEKWAVERNDLNEQVQGLTAKISELESEPKAEEAANHGADEQLQNLQDQLAEIQSEREASQTTQQELQQQCEELQRQLDSQRELAVSFEQTRDELTEQVRRLQSERDENQRDIDQLQGQLASQQEEFAAQLESARQPATNTEPEETFSPTESLDVLDRLRAEVGQPSPDQTHALDVSEEAIEPQVEPADEQEEEYASPQTEEELTFSEPVDVAPVDTAAILAKFGHAVDENDDPTSTQPVDDFPQPSPAADSATTPFASGDDEDGDIQDYMAQLMQRVGTPESKSSAPSDNDGERTVATPTQTPTQAAPVDVESEDSEPAPLEASEFVPRAVAPEASSNLQALRAVANTSARTAIAKHQRRSMDRRALLWGFGAIVSGIVCLSMGLFSTHLISLPSLLSVTAFVVSILTALRAVACTAKGKKDGAAKPNQKQLPGVQPTATADAKATGQPATQGPAQEPSPKN